MCFMIGSYQTKLASFTLSLLESLRVLESTRIYICILCLFPLIEYVFVMSKFGALDYTCVCSGYEGQGNTITSVRLEQSILI